MAIMMMMLMMMTPVIGLQAMIKKMARKAMKLPKDKGEPHEPMIFHTATTGGYRFGSALV